MYFIPFYLLAAALILLGVVAERDSFSAWEARFNYLEQEEDKNQFMVRSYNVQLLEYQRQNNTILNDLFVPDRVDEMEPIQ